MKEDGDNFETEIGKLFFGISPGGDLKNVLTQDRKVV